MNSHFRCFQLFWAKNVGNFLGPHSLSQKNYIKKNYVIKRDYNKGWKLKIYKNYKCKYAEECFQNVYQMILSTDVKNFDHW